MYPNPLLGKTVSNRIAAYRSQAGVTQQALAEAAGWRQSRISNYENCLRRPGMTDARVLCRAFGELGVDVTLDDLFPAPEESAA